MIFLIRLDFILILLNHVTQANEVRVVEQDFQPTFLIKMLPKVNWSVLVDAVQSVSRLKSKYNIRVINVIRYVILRTLTDCCISFQIGHAESAGLPPTINEDSTKSEDFLRKAHHALFEVF